MSAPVRSSHSRARFTGDSEDWSGLEATGEDNLVDGWWTSESLSTKRTWAPSSTSDRDHGVVGPSPVQDPGPAIYSERFSLTRVRVPSASDRFRAAVFRWPSALPRCSERQRRTLQECGREGEADGVEVGPRAHGEQERVA